MEHLTSTELLEGLAEELVKKEPLAAANWVGLERWAKEITAEMEFAALAARETLSMQGVVVERALLAQMPQQVQMLAVQEAQGCHPQFLAPLTFMLAVAAEDRLLEVEELAEMVVLAEEAEAEVELEGLEELAAPQMGELVEVARDHQAGMVVLTLEEAAEDVLTIYWEEVLLVAMVDLELW